jgi:hypothetical protein
VSQDRGAGSAADGHAVYQISGARPGLSEDISGRTRRYIISMSIRTVCFPIAVFTEGWVRWLFVAAAILLPYFAVIAANAGRERVDALPATALNSRLALPPGVGAVRAPDDVDGFLRATKKVPTEDNPEPTDWQRRTSA